MLPTLIDLMAWADARAHTSIAAMPESAVRDRTRSLYAHIVAIDHAWITRFEQGTAAGRSLLMREVAAFAVDGLQRVSA